MTTGRRALAKTVRRELVARPTEIITVRLSCPTCPEQLATQLPVRNTLTVPLYGD